MITSLANDQIKQIRKLRERKYREQSSKYFIEGIRIVYEAVEHNQPVENLIYAPELIHNETGQRLVEIAIGKGIDCIEVSKVVFLSLSQKEGSQGIGAVLTQKWTAYEDAAADFTGVWIALLEIADPGNLGTILRTADAVGAKGILLVGNCTDPYDPTALRANMGGIYSLALMKMRRDEFITRFSDHKTAVIGTSDSGSLVYRQAQFPRNMILLMGSEREGLDEDFKAVCSDIVKIPMRGSCDSLNLSVATGIVLYEILYQHSKNDR